MFPKACQEPPLPPPPLASHAPCFLIFCGQNRPVGKGRNPSISCLFGEPWHLAVGLVQGGQHGCILIWHKASVSMCLLSAHEPGQVITKDGQAPWPHKVKPPVLPQAYPPGRWDPPTRTCTKASQEPSSGEQILVSQAHQLPLVPMLGLACDAGQEEEEGQSDIATALKEPKDKKRRVQQAATAGGRWHRKRQGRRGPCHLSAHPRGRH